MSNQIIEKERIDKWLENKARESYGYSFKEMDINNTGNSIHLKTVFTDPNLTDQQKHELRLSGLCAATGTASRTLGNLLFTQAISASFKDQQFNTADIANATQQALIAMNPTDIYEGMLCNRLVVLHNQYMNFMVRAAHPKQNQPALDLNINRATKLMRVYNDTLDALNRHRRKGEQRVTVQHVNVNSGGKAIVNGEVTGGG